MNRTRSNLWWVSLLLLCNLGWAHGFDSDDVEIRIVGDQRGVLRQIPAGGHGKVRRAYVVARHGERYRIRIRNRTGERIGLVIAVDGRNIVNGRMSWLGPDEAKYVLGPWKTAEYEGWRTSRRRVHRFYFTDPEDSYAEAWGDRTAMGVIAVAVYRERPHRIQRIAPERKRPALRGEIRAQSPGTGFGEGARAPARRVHFEPRRKPALKKFIRYEWRRTLCRRGLLRCGRGNRFWNDDAWEEDDGGDFAPTPWELQMDRW